MTGEVVNSLEDTVTKPLPITKVASGVVKYWPDMLIPIVILYSPTLRLRYRAALACCCNQINLACSRYVFDVPQEAPNKLAIEIENFGVEPPLGVVYVKDCPDRKVLDGTVQVYQDDKGVVNSAVVTLPRAEETPYLTLGVTMHELCHLLGLPHSDNPGSVMYTIARARPQLLSDADADALGNIYNNL